MTVNHLAFRAESRGLHVRNSFDSLSLVPGDESCPDVNIERGLQPICGRCKTPLPLEQGPVTVTDATFRSEVAESALPVLLDMWAPWCVVAAMDAGHVSAPDEPTLCSFVMELVPGQDLEHYVQTAGPLSPVKACDVIHRVAAALAEAVCRASWSFTDCGDRMGREQARRLETSPRAIAHRRTARRERAEAIEELGEVVDRAETTRAIGPVRTCDPLPRRASKDRSEQ